MAALVCAGREEEAMQTLERFGENRAALLKNSPELAQDPKSWRKKINFFQNEKVRNDFDKGAALVQRFLFDGSGSI